MRRAPSSGAAAAPPPGTRPRHRCAILVGTGPDDRRAARLRTRAALMVRLNSASRRSLRRRRSSNSKGLYPRLPVGRVGARSWERIGRDHHAQNRHSVGLAVTELPNVPGDMRDRAAVIYAADAFYEHIGMVAEVQQSCWRIAQFGHGGWSPIWLCECTHPGGGVPICFLIGIVRS
jgi:hypothetical protein